MLTPATRFDTLGYFEKLTAAGMPETQARVQAEVFREQAEFQARELQELIQKYDESRRKDLATKGDIQDVRLEIEKVRSETEKVRSETEKVRSELKIDIERVKYDLLKWQIGGWIALAAIMAKGFGWLGF